MKELTDLLTQTMPAMAASAAQLGIVQVSEIFRIFPDVLAVINEQRQGALTRRKRWAREQAQLAARTRHSKGTKAVAKAQVKDRFKAWQRTPTLYKSTAAFARDMLEKHPPEVLSSQQVVERWVREWRLS